MADNVRASAGTNDGAVFATDDDLTAHHPYVKLEFGGDGTFTKVSAVDPLPVVQTGTHNIGTVTTVSAVTAITNALPAGTNAIGKLAANSGVDIGDVDVTSVVPGTGATSLGKAVDAVAGATDTGVAPLAVRDDALSALTPIEGDYAPLRVDANGALWVKAVNGDAQVVDDAAFTPATTAVVMVGFEADEAATDSVDEGDGGAARMTLDRKVIVNPQPHTGGGLLIFRSLDLDETEEEVKATAGQVYGWFIANLATTTRFVKFYNATAANVTVGTTTPVMTLAIPGNASDDVAAHVMGAHGIAFDTAITVAATTGIADADTGAPAANDVLVNIFYK